MNHFNYKIPIKDLKNSGQMFRIIRETALVLGVKSVIYSYADMNVSFMNRVDRDKVLLELRKYTKKI